MRETDRKFKAYQMRQDGMKFKAIGEALGCSVERARQLVATAERHLIGREKWQSLGWPGELSERAINCLRQMLGKHEFSAADVAAIPYVQFLEMPNLGKKTIAEISEALTYSGLKILGQDEYEAAMAQEAADRAQAALERAQANLKAAQEKVEKRAKDVETKADAK